MPPTGWRAWWRRPRPVAEPVTDAARAAPVVDLRQPRRIHVIGVGGAGMSAIATVLARMGHRVSGSDLKPSAVAARLEALGVEVHIGHTAANVPADADAVTASTAVPASNPEVVAARDAGIPVLRRADALAA